MHQLARCNLQDHVTFGWNFIATVAKLFVLFWSIQTHFMRTIRSLVKVYSSVDGFFFFYFFFFLCLYVCVSATWLHNEKLRKKE